MNHTILLLQVRLPQKPSVQWVSMESCTEPDPCQGVVPPPCLGKKHEMLLTLVVAVAQVGSLSQDAAGGCRHW